MDIKKLILPVAISGAMLTVAISGILFSGIYSEGKLNDHVYEKNGKSDISEDIRAKTIGIELSPAQIEISSAESAPWVGDDTGIHGLQRFLAENNGSPGFSGRMSELLKKHRVDYDMESMLSIDDLPADYRVLLEEAMESYRKKGYVLTSEEEIDFMQTIYNHVTTKDLGNLSGIEKLDDTLFSNYDYLGAVTDKDVLRVAIENSDVGIQPGFDATVSNLEYGGENDDGGGVRRVFRHEAGYLSLHEARLDDGRFSLLQKEFVNKHVNGYPAAQVTSCSPSQRCITSLVWLTEEKRYELSFSGDLSSMKENELLNIAQSLNISYRGFNSLGGIKN